jgi:hypothetical protein
MHLPFTYGPTKRSPFANKYWFCQCILSNLHIYIYKNKYYDLPSDNCPFTNCNFTSSCMHSQSISVVIMTIIVNATLTVAYNTHFFVWVWHSPTLRHISFTDTESIITIELRCSKHLRYRYNLIDHLLFSLITIIRSYSYSARLRLIFWYCLTNHQYDWSITQVIYHISCW